MKIALIGYGKLGHLIEQVSIEKGHTIVAKYNTHSLEQLNSDLLRGAEICIDFSHPSCVVDNIKILTSLGKSIVVGTTGWYDQLEEVKEVVLQSKVGFLYSPNFSVGMLLFMHIVRHASKLFSEIEGYDVGGMEIHHKQKADTPSGTAQSLAQIIMEEFPKKRSVVYEVDRELAPSELNFSSLRCGSFPGAHSIFFDGTSDTIELKHSARDRLSFARGAVAAAEWLRHKTGFFSLEDIFLKKKTV